MTRCWPTIALANSRSSRPADLGDLFRRKLRVHLALSLY